MEEANESHGMEVVIPKGEKLNCECGQPKSTETPVSGGRSKKEGSDWHWNPKVASGRAGGTVGSG